MIYHKHDMETLFHLSRHLSAALDTGWFIIKTFLQRVVLKPLLTGMIEGCTQEKCLNLQNYTTHCNSG